ncbi:MAG TPA: M28 family peptidase [Candidatus Thermoplasmatota archaeon]|nr:M28 family peptidase [Candidatus Thermoplasmatota archaeon]
MRPHVLVLAALLLAGCAAPAPAAESPPASPGELRVGGALLHAGGAAGALSLVHLAEGERADVTFPRDVLVLAPDGRLVPGGEPVTIRRGEIAQYLAPYGATSVGVRIAADGETRDETLALGPLRPFVSGERVVELMKVQEERFAHRTPGHENYSKAVAYFGEFFANLSYDVETFRTPLPDVKLPVAVGPSTQSVVSVLGYKRGLEQPDRYIVMGGHFDVVEQTTHGAFDNTGGTMAVLALAEAFAKLNTSRSLVFAAWGGEEDGILGSQAWLAAHPELVPKIDLYVNFDVTGLAWPAPLVAPASVVAATGPDGPVGDALAAHHRAVVADWMKLDAPFVYEGVGHGQLAGAGVNAQSDHTPFMARGIPVLFQFTQDIRAAFTLIHKEADTVENMTAYALHGAEGVGRPLDEAQRREGDQALARSFETQMMAGFYLAVLTDHGAMSSRPASLPALANARS